MLAAVRLVKNGALKEVISHTREGSLLEMSYANADGVRIYYELVGSGPRLCNALFLMVLEASESKLQQVRINRA